LVSPCLVFSFWYFSLIFNHLFCTCFHVLCVFTWEFDIEFFYKLNTFFSPKGLAIILPIFFLTHSQGTFCSLQWTFSIKLPYKNLFSPQHPKWFWTHEWTWTPHLAWEQGTHQLRHLP
jgi:hypothetical protein